MRICIDCGEKTRRDGRAKRCIDCAHIAATRYQVPNAKQLACFRIVGIAVKAGILPRVDTKFCVDCGEPAQDYDHRDYMKPLEVQPVCKSCNKRRGPGLNRITEEFDREAVTAFGDNR